MKVRRNFCYISELGRQQWELYEAQCNAIHQEADNEIGIIIETNWGYTDMRRNLFPNE